MKTPERWERVEDLFHAALNLEPRERAAFLAEVRASDPELLAEVESLIGAHELEGSFLDSPAYDTTTELATTAQPDPRLGRSVGRYRIVAPLGKGAMGEVYLAEDSSLRRKVAIKFLHAEVMADEHAQKRLIREAQAAANLDHPNICRIHEVGTDDGQSFIVMQYVEGETLTNRIRRKPLKIGEALAIAVQLSDALSEAHSRQVVHRDIKPSNIMITARGQATLMDFGIAKFVGRRSPLETVADTESTLTEPGVLLGTVPYMSPEQVRGEELDGRSDVFSLGVVLYEMVSGRQPFSADSAAGTLSAILSHDPPPIGTRADVPAELQRIVRKCLEKDRERRYQSARDLYVDLSNLVRDRNLGTGAGEEAPQPRRTARRVALIAVVTTVALIGVGRYCSSQTPTTKAVTSIAVLPFINATGDPTAEYFSDGITEDIINNLTQLSGLKVMARTTVFQYKGMGTDPREIGRTLGVDAVLTGKVEARGAIFIVRTELVNVADGSQLWSDKYDREPSHVPEGIAKQISEKLQVKLSGAEERRLAEKRDTDNTEAYRLYLRGRYQVYKYTDFEKAIEYFTQAIALDDNYALPHAGLAEAYFHAADVQFSPKEAMARVKEEASKALKSDPLLAEAHVAMGRYLAYYDWNWSEAEKEFTRAIDLNPKLPTAYHEYGVFLSWKGRADEADAQMKKALDLDPVSVMIRADYGNTLYWRRETDRAIDQYRSAINLDSTFWGTHLYLGICYAQKSDYAKAEDEFKKAYDNSGGIAVTVAAFGRFYAEQGKKAEAEKVLKQLDDMKKKSYVSSFYIASIYAGLGDKDQAIKWLNRAYDEKSDYLVYLNVMPLLDSLRGEPGFKELVRRVGLSQ